MPIKRCNEGGPGWRWGDQGECYHGPGARQKAMDQGIAALASQAKEAGVDVNSYIKEHSSELSEA